MPSVTSSKGPIQLHYEGGQVVVTPEDQDRFVMGARQAITACQGELAATRFVHQFFSQFIRELHAWCGRQERLVRGCYVPLPVTGGCIKVFIVSKSKSFDFELSDLIADLEHAMDDQGWPCDILQIAAKNPEEFRVFFDPEQSILVFGNGDDIATSEQS